MAKKNRNDLLDRLACIPVRGLVGLAGAMPYRARLSLAGYLGRTIVVRNTRLKMRIDRNLAHVFPAMSPDERKRVLMQTGDTFGRTFLEILRNKDFLAHGAVAGPSGPGAQAILDAAAAGKGAIAVSGHFGQWEGCRAWMKAHGINCAGVYRPTENPHLNEIYRQGLSIGGSPIFAKGPRGMRGLVAHLAKGNLVSLLIDQYDHRAAPLDFVGRPAPTSLFAAQLARKYDVPLVPMFAWRLDDGEHVQVEADPPVPHGDESDMMQAVNDALAARIRAHPGQYYWLHRRWSKSLPDAGEAEVA
jgi:Kdo2-lipid IVA lauroyltransferase/acyltransferase